ncbi:Ribosomal large subunit pseudouridine synthase D [hydrothermal vent metagenome]|uniref:Ribosomal large subunit pseudouridine synthase D n=1 Tax=hydrothermal vent metagenome TaxID=652676 RepID=A0A3B0ZFH8_9ZZZZ
MTEQSNNDELIREIDPAMAGLRLDHCLQQIFSEYSRARLQKWVKEGKITIDGRLLRSKDKVFGGETIILIPEVEAQERWQPEAIDLDIVYEDAAVIVLNKPAGLVVHPAAGNQQGTLLNALLHHAPELNEMPRAGIVHRLDKETTGLMVVARTLTAQKTLVEQLQARTVTREYFALVMGTIIAGGTLEWPIGRHRVDRKRMAVVDDGKPAMTHYRVLERYAHHTYLKVNLSTGRTHQIRVHFSHMNHPLIGDPVYGGRLRIPKQANDELANCLRGFRRQALHAGRLKFEHPLTRDSVEFSRPVPKDMEDMLNIMREHNPVQPVIRK